MSNAGWIDDLEADLGLDARLRLVDLVVGCRRHIPLRRNIENSRLASEVGLDIASWLSGRFGGHELEIPTRTSSRRSAANSYLVADILEAGLENPTRTINDLARTHGVTRRWVLEVYRRLRIDAGKLPPLPLFDGVLDPDAGRERLHRAKRRP